MKWLINLFCSASKLAKMAASGIKTGVNGTGKQETIAKYSTIISSITDNAAKVNRMLNDGTIDDTEEAEIAAMLEPLFAKVLELV